VLEHPESLLAALIRREAAWAPVDFAWDLPGLHEVSDANRQQLHHARSFSELIHAAQLLYNLMLAEASENATLLDHYRSRMELWRATVESRARELEAWAREELPDFWVLVRSARVTPPARRFVEDFLARVLSSGPARLVDDAQARGLVHAREVFLKRRLARLVNRTSLSIWGGAAGASQLDVRWGIGQRLLLDILPAPDGADA
jgi:hypothetical protein